MLIIVIHIESTVISSPIIIELAPENNAPFYISPKTTVIVQGFKGI